MIMFKASWYCDPRVQRIEVVSETEKFVIIGTNGRREAKQTQYDSWHETFDEAKQACVSQMKNKRDSVLGQLKRIEDRLKEAESITGPNNL